MLLAARDFDFEKWIGIMYYPFIMIVFFFNISIVIFFVLAILFFFFGIIDNV